MLSVAQRCFGPPLIFMSSLAAVRRVGGFEVSMKSCEDWDCWVRQLLSGVQPVIVRRVVAMYRDTPNSMSKNKSRMLLCRTEVLLRLWNASLSRPDVMERVGKDLTSAGQRLLRRLLAQRVAAPEIESKLRAALVDLRRRGFVVPRSRWKGWADTVLGTYAEDLAVAIMTWFEPAQIAYYCKFYD